MLIVTMNNSNNATNNNTKQNNKYKQRNPNITNLS